MPSVWMTLASFVATRCCVAALDLHEVDRVLGVSSVTASEGPVKRGSAASEVADRPSQSMAGAAADYLNRQART